MTEFAHKFQRSPLRALLNTPLTLFLTVVSTWFLFGAAFAALEPEIGLFDGVYLSSVVQSTLGFGDVLPTWWATKLLIMLYVYFSLFIVLPAAIFHIGERLLEDKDEFNDDDKEEMMTELRAELGEIRRLLSASEKP